MIAKTAKFLAVYFGVLSLACILMPFFNALAGSYEGIGMLISFGILAVLFALLSLGLYGCYLYEIKVRNNRVIESFVIVFVVIAGILGGVVIARIIDLMISATRHS